MEFNQLPIEGAYQINLEKHGDDRGFFARCFCSEEFSSHGLDSAIVQSNDSFSAERGTLRGLHYQLPPMAEQKIVRCIQGALWDVILDLRLESKTFGEWFAVELSAKNRTMVVVPKGCAHGFLTLEENSEVIYFVSEHYSPHYERGIRWDDPKFAIDWPFTPVVISEKDRTHPDFNPEIHLNHDKTTG